MTWFWHCVVVVAMMTGMAFGVATGVSALVGRGSATHRRRGRYVVGWVTGGVLLGGGLALWEVDAASARYFHEFGNSYMCIGLIAGVLVGNVHGFLATPQPPDER